ncbi:acyltransferase family protein [Escherichia coli]|jgi:fucose 4-O-acetylase-like acetyltransferase|uniref:Acyltransferase 3 domain-containing protein n=4 Tax=Enterobacteriaceae TaxID=543 RepID=A0A2S8D7G5_SHIDY|nr:MULTISPECIES: acyltransferase family protein [Enterobacteriaceae]EHT2168583.1 acyltransferase family protein [Escherichia coli O168]EEQ1658904.1 acyltransferase family protein [Escherichia coli]EFC4564288.1 hypothetical protein [Escherichia coli]EFC7690445.1 acyltransferase family protein [Escherichia coli]EFF5369231.1 acyltransferase family protein [Escherichia coli]
METKKRLGYIDAVKGFGIILVVYAHIISGLSSYVIYLFHMPLFFIVSGILFKEPNDKNKFIVGKVKSLIVPYFSYSILLFVVFSSYNIMRDGYDSKLMIKQLIKMVYGGQVMTGWFGVFWFIPVMFFTLIVLMLISEKLRVAKDKWLLAFILLMCSYVLSWLVKFPIPLNANVVLYAVPLAMVGLFYKECNVRLLFFIVVSIVLLFIAIAYQKIFMFDMKTSLYGVPFVSFIINIVFSVVVIELFKRLDGNYIKPLEIIGKASLTIMFVHQMFHFILAEYMREGIAMFMITLILSIITHEIFTRIALTRVLFLGGR